MSLVSSFLRLFLALPLAVLATEAAALCDGRYARAERLIDAAYAEYGTLYSGGPALSSLGPTLEIYRLLEGLPEAGLTEKGARGEVTIDPPGQLDDPSFAGETLLRSLARVHDPAFRRVGPEGATDSEILLNLLTIIGPYPGWWLDPEAPHLREVERAIAAYAVDDALDWLLTVQAASDRSHTVSWTLLTAFRDGRTEAMRRLFRYALSRFAETERPTWLLAALLTREDRLGEWRMSDDLRHALKAAEGVVERLAPAVEACSASAADYAVFAIAAFENLRLSATGYRRRGAAKDLRHIAMAPPILRHIAATHLAKLTWGPVHHRRANWSAEAIVNLADAPRFASWLNIGRSYRAASLDHLIALNAGVKLAPKTLRLLNMLSTEDLLTFAQSRDGFDGERRRLITAAFLRLFALGEDARAAALADEVIALWPSRAVLMRAVWRGEGARGYRLARLALTLPEPRTLLAPTWVSWRDTGDFADAFQSDTHLQVWAVSRRSLDLPLAIRTGGFLSRDFRRWMTETAARRYAIQHRAYRRGRSFPDPLTATTPIIPETGGLYGRPAPGLANFAGWDELARLGPKAGLANRIGRELILNARAELAGPVAWLRADREALARDLELVIRQGRRMIHGEMEGRPLGKAAFELLHRRLGGTEAAARTPYWYICRERCEL